MSNYSATLTSRNCIIGCSVDSITISQTMRNGPQLTTVICSQCGLVYTNLAPTQEVYYSFYSNDYERYNGKTTASRSSASIKPIIFSSIGQFIDIKTSDYLEVSQWAR